MLSFENTRHTSEIVRDMVAAIRELLDTDTLPTNGQRVRDLMVDLAERLDCHFRSEDMRLYPQLSMVAAASSQGAGARLAGGVGGLGRPYAEVIGQWSAPGRIERDPDAFVAEIEQMLTAVVARVGATAPGPLALV